MSWHSVSLRWEQGRDGGLEQQFVVEAEALGGDSVMQTAVVNKTSLHFKGACLLCVLYLSCVSCISLVCLVSLLCVLYLSCVSCISLVCLVSLLCVLYLSCVSCISCVSCVFFISFVCFLCVLYLSCVCFFVCFLCVSCVFLPNYFASCLFLEVLCVLKSPALCDKLIFIKQHLKKKEIKKKNVKKVLKILFDLFFYKLKKLIFF